MPAKKSKDGKNKPKSPRTQAKEREADLPKPKHPMFRAWLEELEEIEIQAEERRIADIASPTANSPTRRDHEPPSEVIPGYMWLSGMPEAKGMEHLPFDSFDMVVYAQSSRDAKTPFECAESHLVYCYDTPDTDISPFFGPTHDFINAKCPLEYSRGKPKHKLLIHCTQGVSRSVSLLAAHLMLEYKCTLRDALLFIKWRRSRAAPNKGFIDQLVRFERELYPDMFNPSITYKQAQKMGMVY